MIKAVGSASSFSKAHRTCGQSSNSQRDRRQITSNSIWPNSVRPNNRLCVCLPQQRVACSASHSLPSSPLCNLWYLANKWCIRRPCSHCERKFLYTRLGSISGSATGTRMHCHASSRMLRSCVWYSSPALCQKAGCAASSLSLSIPWSVLHTVEHLEQKPS